MATSEAGHRPLNVLISGAGIGGLAAATALRQAGHLVQVFERSSFKNEYGAGVSIAPNANGLLRNMGLALEDIGGVNAVKATEYGSDDTLFRCIDLVGMTTKYKYPCQYVHRVDLHNGLRKLAASTTGKGTPVITHLSSRVVSVDPETATLTLENGEKVHGDIVVVADGVKSALRESIDHSGAKPAPFGISSYRFMIPTDILYNDPQTRQFVENGEFEFWSGGSSKIVFYPCRDGKVLGCTCLVEDYSPQDKGEWTGTALKEEISRQINGWHPGIVALVEKADPNGVGFWPLYDMPKLETWINGRAVLVGDAAHPFLPFQGQGAAQAIENARALAVLLPINQTWPEDIPERLKLYQAARYERVGAIQQTSRDIEKEDEKVTKQNGLTFKFTDYNFSHDAREHAAGLLKQTLVTEIMLN